MAQITLQGNPFQTCGDLPAVGSQAPDFQLVAQDLSDATLATFAGKKVVLNVFPSIDTPVCAVSVRTFNEKATATGAAVLNVSADLPFAMKRFCGAEGLAGVQSLSTFRGSFATDYGLQVENGPLAGLCSRAVVVLDGSGKVIYTEQVPEIAQEPNYDAALSALGETASA